MKNFKEIPIVIICHNRLFCMMDQIEGFLERGYFNLHIADCGSSYPPLLEYLSKNNGKLFTVHRFDNPEAGPYVYQRTYLGNLFTQNYNILTDNDVILTKECPDNFAEHLYNIIQEFNLLKAGVGLKIDDLPDHYPLKNDVIRHESDFWRRPMKPGVFQGAIDTTLALNRPGFHGGYTESSARTDAPYMARHFGWYMDYNNLPDDEKYYHKLNPPASSWLKEWHKKKGQYPEVNYDKTLQ